MKIVVLEALGVTIVGIIFAIIIKLIINYFSSINKAILRNFSLLLIPILSYLVIISLIEESEPCRTEYMGRPVGCYQTFDPLPGWIVAILILLPIIFVISYIYWFKKRYQLKLALEYKAEKEKQREVQQTYEKRLLQQIQQINKQVSNLMMREPNHPNHKELIATRDALTDEHQRLNQSSDSQLKQIWGPFWITSIDRITSYHFWVFLWFVTLFTSYIVTRDLLLAAIIIAVPPSMLAIKQLNTPKPQPITS